MIGRPPTPPPPPPSCTQLDPWRQRPALEADVLNCWQTAGSGSTGRKEAFKVMNLKPLMSHLAVYGTARSPEAEPYCAAAAVP